LYYIITFKKLPAGRIRKLVRLIVNFYYFHKSKPFRMIIRSLCSLFIIISCCSVRF